MEDNNKIRSEKPESTYIKEPKTADTLLDDTVDISVPVEESNESRRIVRQSWYLGIGAVGIFSAYAGVLSLQSSLNFDDSIGTTSLTICFVTTLLLNATVVPILLQALGAKFLLLLSDATFIAFTLANLIPVKYTLYPAAILLGIGESLVWPSITMFNAQFAIRYISASSQSEKPKTRNKKRDAEYDEVVAAKTRWFTGRFFGIFSVNQIIGSLMAYTILVFDSKEIDDSMQNETARLVANATESTYVMKCGASDCYEYANHGGKENLGVANPAIRYILFACYTALQIGSLAFHKFLLKDPEVCDSSTVPRQLSIKSILKFPTKILRHMVSPLQLLISPINIHSGMMMGFIYGEITRSYIACPLGVEQVGLAMTFFGVSAVIGSLVFQLGSRYIRKNYFAALCFAMEASLLIFCRFWQPSSNGPRVWQIYVTAAIFGFPDSIRQAIIAATYPEYFITNKSVAFSMLAMCTAAGFAIMFAIGTSICVSTKITIMLSVLSFAIFCYCVAEIYFHKIKVRQ